MGMPFGEMVALGMEVGGGAWRAAGADRCPSGVVCYDK